MSLKLDTRAAMFEFRNNIYCPSPTNFVWCLVCASGGREKVVAYEHAEGFEMAEIEYLEANEGRWLHQQISYHMDSEN